MKRFVSLVLTVFTVAVLFAAARPSLDGRAVVCEEGEMPKGLFARTIGYLPGDSVTVTNPANGCAVDVLILGAIDASEGVAILLTPEAADRLGFRKDSNVQVKITKRTGSLDENVSGTAVLAEEAEEDYLEGSLEEKTETIPQEQEETALQNTEDNIEETAENPADISNNENAVETSTENEVEQTGEEIAEPVAEDSAVEEPFADELEDVSDKNDWENVVEEKESSEIFEDENSEKLQEVTEFSEPYEEKENLPVDADFFDENNSEECELVSEYENIPDEAEETVQDALDGEEIVSEKKEVNENTEEKIETSDELLRNQENSEEKVEETFEENVPEKSDSLDSLDSLDSPDSVSEDEKIENEGITSDEDSNVQTEAEKVLEIEEPASEDESGVEETEVAEKTEVTETEEEYSPIILVPVEPNPPETEEVEESEKAEKLPENEGDVLAVTEKIAQEVPVLDDEKTEDKNEESVVSDNTDDSAIQIQKIAKNSLAELEKGKYYLQIATLRNEDNIKNLLKKYTPKYPVVLVKHADGISFQILVGPLSADEYGMITERFKSYGFKDCFLRKIK